jgi:hypothetical protein
MASVTAEAMLEVGNIDVVRVRHHLRRVDPARVRVVVAPSWLRFFWPKRISAVCMAWAVYVQPEIMARFERRDRVDSIGTLIAHELVHLEQWRRLGPIRHTVRYVGDYLVGRFRRLRHWEAYRAIGLEREARHVAAVITAESRR